MFSLKHYPTIEIKIRRLNAMNHALGKIRRRCVSLREIRQMLMNEATAEKWFVEARWPKGVCCPECGSQNVQSQVQHKTMPFRCRDCRKRFSARTGTAMEASSLGYQVWALAIYLLTMSLESVSSTKLHQGLGVTQKTAWLLALHLREAWQAQGKHFAGSMEMAGRGSVGEIITTRAKDHIANCSIGFEGRYDRNEHAIQQQMGSAAGKQLQGREEVR